MFKNKIFLGVLAFAVFGILIYSLNTQNTSLSSKSYFVQIKESRKVLDENLRNDKDSPLEDKSIFEGLKYYEPDSIFILKADYQVVSQQEQKGFMMTDSSKGELKQVAFVTFQLTGKNFKLALFQENENFFLPFRDRTNGKETYGGGRYINIPAANLRGNKIEIDFNEAHNFYCAYNHTYVCPVPPPENFMDFEVKVGEKKLKERF